MPSIATFFSHSSAVSVSVTVPSPLYRKRPDGDGHPFNALFTASTSSSMVTALLPFKSPSHDDTSAAPLAGRRSLAASETAAHGWMRMPATLSAPSAISSAWALLGKMRRMGTLSTPAESLGGRLESGEQLGIPPIPPDASESSSKACATRSVNAELDPQALDRAQLATRGTRSGSRPDSR